MNSLEINYIFLNFIQFVFFILINFDIFWMCVRFFFIVVSF